MYSLVPGMLKNHLKYKLRDKSDAELQVWLTQQKPGSRKYRIGLEETMRRVALLEGVIEEAEESSRHREAIALIIAVAAIALIITGIILFY